jgi:murein L,D-transpeptidase YcbB/YkuD
LRQRLAASGDLAKAAVNGSKLYDRDVEEAVRSLQLRYGLKPDGRLGRNTLAVLNVPARTRLAQIIVNMERRRWLPDDLGVRHVLVNQAEFRLHVVENGKEVYSSRVVVGKPSNQTPEFSNSIKLVVLNPYWGVPRSIATKEILPILRRNPGYLARKNMVLVGRNGKAVNPASVNWAAVSRSGFRYGIRQRPGAGNALGRIKFLFPNKHSVYLHDTPSKSLFSRFRRAFSHGCVRVQNPVRFAEVLMKPQFGWSQDAINARIARRRNQTIRLKTHIPIHLTYQTAWVDARGTVHFRADMYGRDARLRKALQLPAMVTRLAQLLSTEKAAE